MSPWNWKPERTQGIWRYGTPSMKPLVACAPWLTVLLLLAHFWIVGDTLVTAKGILFDLPESGLGEGETTGAVALIVPVPHETLVFFDDSRYILGDAASAATLGEHFAEIGSRNDSKTLLALADRRVSAGELMKFAALARRNGIHKVLFAEKREGTDE